MGHIFVETAFQSFSMNMQVSKIPTLWISIWICRCSILLLQRFLLNCMIWRSWAEHSASYDWKSPAGKGKGSDLHVLPSAFFFSFYYCLQVTYNVTGHAGSVVCSKCYKQIAVSVCRWNGIMVCFFFYFFSSFITIEVVLPAALGGSFCYMQRAELQSSLLFTFLLIRYH